MMVAESFQQFQIQIRPSPETNDHEVRFFADGEDLIQRFWNDMIGLDPDDILVAPCPLDARVTPHEATVARCSCGVIDCGSVSVDIERVAQSVRWSWGAPVSRQELTFVAGSYDQEVARALADKSWETPDRTAARLLSEQVDRQFLADHGLVFAWGSGRIRQHAFSISLMLEPGPYQILVHLPWNGEPPESIAQQCAKLLRTHPSDWSRAEWYPQQANLGPPTLAGPSWRRGD